jgi:hypothetical protein
MSLYSGTASPLEERHPSSVASVMSDVTSGRPKNALVISGVPQHHVTAITQHVPNEVAHMAMVNTSNITNVSRADCTLSVLILDASVVVKLCDTIPFS